MGDYIEKTIARVPALREVLTKLSDLHARKLWHQLTDELIVFLKDPSHSSQLDYAELYEVSPFLENGQEAHHHRSNIIHFIPHNDVYTLDAHTHTRHARLSLSPLSLLRSIQNFVSKFEAKMNQLRLAVAASYVAKAAANPESALAFLSKLAEKRERLGVEAALFVDMEIVLLKLKQVRQEGGWIDDDDVSLTYVSFLSSLFPFV